MGGESLLLALFSSIFYASWLLCQKFTSTPFVSDRLSWPFNLCFMFVSLRCVHNVCVCGGLESIIPPLTVSRSKKEAGREGYLVEVHVLLLGIRRKREGRFRLGRRRRIKRCGVAFGFTFVHSNT